MGKRLHTLSEYIEMLHEKGMLAVSEATEEDKKKIVRYISYNSLDIKFNTVFICKGEHFKEQYLWDAASSGACAYISEKKYDAPQDTKNGDIPCIRVTDIRKTMAYLANFFYNEVWNEITLIGITGTKGKSTTSYFMKAILDDYLKSVNRPASAIISGIDNYDGIINEESHLTTPEAFELHQHFNNAVKTDIEYLTMEVSSQALKYDRVMGVQYDIGCFLNIGEDHISDLEHPNFEDYLNSKLLLFKQCDTACVNLNSDNSIMILRAAKDNAKRVITFGTVRTADIFAYDIEATSKEITFKVKCDSFDREFKISMHGLFNVENALAAISMAYALDIPLENIANGLRRAQVSGRMEIYTNNRRDINVIVDYAHNRMSFESLFNSMRKEFPGKKISIVFGCPGRKALGRRKELGEIAGKYSNKVYITEEDAGEEPVMKICEEIAKHVEEQACLCDIITDRREAIKQAIMSADSDTLVLITGKGRETRQKRGTKYIDTPSDVEYVKEFLKEK